MEKHLFHLSTSFYLSTMIPSLSPQVPSDLPSAQSMSGQPIVYAPTLMPSGDLAPSIIGFAAPTVASLLEGQIREPITKASGKRKPPVIKRLTKKPKIAYPKKPANGNPQLDSNVEEFLDEALMKEEIDKSTADISDTEDQTAADPRPADVATPPRSPAQSDIQASPKPRQRRTICKVKPKVVSAMAKDKYFPMPPLSPSLQASPVASPRAPSASPHWPAPSDQAPSTAGSHHVEEQEKTTAASMAQNLADMFSFDIRQFLDEEDEQTTSKAKSTISDDLRARLLDIADWMRSSLDALVDNCGPIRERFQEIQDQLPEEVSDTMSPAMFLEQHRFKLQRAEQRIADRFERQSIEVTIQSSR